MPTTNWASSSSSQIKEFRHNPETNEMDVRFHSSDVPYRYSNVDAEKFEAFANAESHGKHLNAHIKSDPTTHSFRKLVDGEF